MVTSCKVVVDGDRVGDGGRLLLGWVNVVMIGVSFRFCLHGTATKEPVM